MWGLWGVWFFGDPEVPIWCYQSGLDPEELWLGPEVTTKSFLNEAVRSLGTESTGRQTVALIALTIPPRCFSVANFSSAGPAPGTGAHSTGRSAAGVASFSSGLCFRWSAGAAP